MSYAQRYFTIYTTPSCKWCSLLKDMLRNYAEHYVEVLLSDTRALMSFRQEYPNLKTVPQVFLHDGNGGTVHVGGYMETRDLLMRPYPQ